MKIIDKPSINDKVELEKFKIKLEKFKEIYNFWEKVEIEIWWIQKDINDNFYTCSMNWYISEIFNHSNLVKTETFILSLDGDSEYNLKDKVKKLNSRRDLIKK